MTLDEACKQVQEQHVALTKMPNVTPEHFARFEAHIAGLLNQHPDHPLLLFHAGTVSTHLDRAGVGIALIRRAIDCGANASGAWINLGGAYKREHLDKQAIECFTKAIELAKAENSKDDLMLAYNSMAGVHVNAGRPQQCIYWADEALKVGYHPSAEWNKGLALLESGQWEEGFRIYDEAGFKLAHMDTAKRKLKTYGGLPQWDGTKGQTVIVYGEQGIGDEVMLASIIPDLMQDCKVIIDCDKRLLALMKRSFPGLEGAYPTSDIDAPFEWIKNHKVDAQISMGSLGRYYRKKDADFPKRPYFIADQEKRAKWRKELARFGGLKIGISYLGGHKATRQDKRSIDLRQWKDILTLPKCNFFSLQYHPFADDDASAIGTELGVSIHCWRDTIDAYDETAAFIQELDLVITVNTSLHHLCGSLAAHQLCLTPKYVAWRYGVKGPSPWYANCEMLRQSDDGDWGPPLRRARERVLEIGREVEAAAA